MNGYGAVFDHAPEPLPVAVVAGIGNAPCAIIKVCRGLIGIAQERCGIIKTITDIADNSFAAGRTIQTARHSRLCQSEIFLLCFSSIGGGIAQGTIKKQEGTVIIPDVVAVHTQFIDGVAVVAACGSVVRFSTRAEWYRSAALAKSPRSQAWFPAVTKPLELLLLIAASLF